jgi:hypothetical protein
VVFVKSVAFFGNGFFSRTRRLPAHWQAHTVNPLSRSTRWVINTNRVASREISGRRGSAALPFLHRSL